MVFQKETDMSHYRRRKSPNPFRCIKALYPAAVAIIVLWFYDTAVSIVCNLNPAAAQAANCGAPMPEPLLWALGAAFCYGLAGFSYRFYRDFYCGDLLADRM